VTEEQPPAASFEAPGGAVRPDQDEERPSWRLRMFGSDEFSRLWLTQVVSASGDWLGFLAIAALATRIGAGSPEAAVGFVMAARIVPGFFLGAASGVVADRFDRKKVMVTCDIGRAGVIAILPFVDTVWGLVIASLVMEIFTLLWTPAKEASVPNLVPADHLTTANSLSLVAAYGTMPLAAGLFALLSKLAETLGGIHVLDSLRTSQESLAFYVDALTFVFSAAMVWRLTGIRPAVRKTNGDAGEVGDGKRIDFAQAFREIKEGWQFIFVNPVVRSVNLGLATGLIGGGMLVPLGPVFSIRVLGAGTAGFGFFVFAMGCGVAIGVVLLSVFQKRVPKAEVFSSSLLLGGVSLFLAASMSSLGLAALFVMMLGMCAGSVYVLGFTLLHESVDDELRGRIFSALYTLVRLCVLIAFAIGPLLSDLLDRLSNRLVHREISLFGAKVGVPGVRLTLWLAALIIIGAGLLAVRALGTPLARGERVLDPAELMSGVTAPIAQVKHSHDHPSLRTPRNGRSDPAPPPAPPPTPPLPPAPDPTPLAEPDPRP
jgi:dTMP kinase